MSKFALSERSKSRRHGVDPRLIEISDRAIQITTIDFGIPEDGGVRTAERQNYLYTENYSNCDGYKNRSRHQPSQVDGLGKALDFYAYENGEANWKHHSLAVIAAAHLQAAGELGYRIEWGGLWRSINDYPHIQLVEV